ncbi:MAG TPA: SDR family oxidoreductase [Pseudogracilibacillus sp.]|nr:SDR family oxidoreductase [Pseudogracilibacillus sp.]
MIIVGKVAIVTGASSGIGKTIAIALAKANFSVGLVARRNDKLTEIEKQINETTDGRALAIQTDVSEREEVESMVRQVEETFGPIDVYVNNAGVMLDAKITNKQVHNWEKMIDVNIKGVLYGLHEVIESMVDRQTGHIFNIASVSGFEVTKNSTVYSATKFAVRAISIGLEKELARTGVRVTNISPGMVDTDLVTRGNVDRKILSPKDIAEAVLYAWNQPKHVNVNELTIRPV